MAEEEKFTCPRREEQGMHLEGPFKHSGPNLDTWRQDRSCSYCGSMHPDDFIQYVKDGKKVGSTDKDYKAYVDEDPRIKFYFQHLSAAQRTEFIELYNAKKFNMGEFPFYVLPFFCKRDDSVRGAV